MKKLVCSICNNDIVVFKQVGKHLKCNKQFKSDSDFKFNILIYNYPELKLDTLEFINNIYSIEEYSINEISTKFNISFKNIQFILTYYNINKRSIKEATNCKRKINKSENTCIQKYGEKNVLSKGTSIYEKRNNNVKEKYGVDNVFQLEDVKIKINNTMLQIYGQLRITNSEKISESHKAYSPEKREEIKKKLNITYNNKSEEDKKLLKEKKSKLKKDWWKSLTDEQHNKLYNNQFNKNKLESRISSILTTYFGGNNSFVFSKFIAKRQYDFLLPDKVILEIQGDFWHANPKIYSEFDILHHPGKHKTAKQIWDNDLSKKVLAEKYGYKVIYLWESDINEATDEEIFTIILDKIHILHNI